MTPAMKRRWARRPMMLPGVMLALALLSPGSAQAHGAVDPVATSFEARITSVPPGLRAIIVDGDLRVWLRVPHRDVVVVRDSQGEPYLRLAHGRIWANVESPMFYFNLIPPITPPARLSKTRRIRWVQVGSGDSYEWHDGRLHALALQAVTPGSSDVGTWRIPLLVNGRSAAIVGTLRYRQSPSIFWFWPIAVLLVCELALWRLQDPRLDLTILRALGQLTLLGILLAAIGRGLHGRPGLSILGLVELAIVAALAARAAWQVAHDRAGSFTYFAIAVAALWEGITLIPTLLHGYVLLALPPFLGRVAAVLCLSGSVCLILPILRRLQLEDGREPRPIGGTEPAVSAPGPAGPGGG